MKLSQKRKAILENLITNLSLIEDSPDDFYLEIDQAFNDYTQSIIEMVENHAEEAGWDARAADQLLEELTK